MQALYQGMDPSNIRDHNERLILSLIWQAETLSSSKIARKTSFSAQTASVITRNLEVAGLIRKGQPVKGKIGKPHFPISLNPNGAFAFGLRIGRRQTELILADFLGHIRATRDITYKYPTPQIILSFVQKGIEEIPQEVAAFSMDRVVGIGLAVPFELWKWLDIVGAPSEEMMVWQKIDFAREFSAFTTLPLVIANDGTMACNGELLFGKGRAKKTFGYFFVGTFIGGGLVLDGKLVFGQNNNAGAFGTIPIAPLGSESSQLIHKSSIFVLENMLQKHLGHPISLKNNDLEWTQYQEIVLEWINNTAQGIALAAVSVSSVVDVPDIIIDGNFSSYIRKALVESVNKWIKKVDTRGIVPPRVEEGTIGLKAGAIGAAFQPIASQFFVN